MEKLDKVIAGLGFCGEANKSVDACLMMCPYYGERDGDKVCLDLLMEDALEWLKEQNRLIRELSDNIPCCDNCEGKTVLGERTDKCVYEIEGFDSVIYCAKRGIENCFGYRKKIDALEAKLKEAEPVVHAHWICDCEPYHICSNCRHKFSLFDRVPRCPNCGAHMDEEVVENG